MINPLDPVIGWTLVGICLASPVGITLWFYLTDKDEDDD